MATRRDTELTDDQMVLFQQLRGLFRHVPFTAREFANLAPNVALTLNREQPEQALSAFWDVLDAQERTKHLDALLVLLGMTSKDDNVLHRKSKFNNDVHPRTISRWADVALTGVVRYMDEKYSTARAVVTVALDDYRAEVHGGATVDMDDPTVAIFDEYQRIYWDGDVWHCAFEWPQGRYPVFVVTWEGPVYPRFSIAVDTHKVNKRPHVDVHGNRLVVVQWF